MRQVVRTDVLPAADRFVFWQEMVAQVAMPVEVRSRYAANFPAMVETTSFGAVQTIRLRHPPLDMDRTTRLIRRSDPEVYHLVVNLAGSPQITQDRKVVDLRPGTMALYHSSRVFQTRSDPRLTRESAVVVVLPPSLLPLPAKRLTDLLAVGLSSSDGVGALVFRYLLALARGSGQYAAADAAQLATVTVDLISLMLARRLDIESGLPAESRDQAVLASIHSFIHLRLGEGELTPDAVAAAHHISVRTLHRLFRAHGTTVASWIRERRLDRCRRDLLDPFLRHKPIGVIAARWGYASNAYFSRAFRAAYGVSPSEFRQRQTRDL